MIYHRCEKCQALYELTDDTRRFICGCGGDSGQLFDAQAIRRQQTCQGCPSFNGSRCRLYLRPCSTTKLWRGLLDPPEQCPRAELFVDPE